MKTLPIGDASVRGFTLLELTVVLAIIGLLMAIAVPAFRSFVPRFRLAAASRELTEDLRGARREALTDKTVVPVVFDTADAVYVIGEHRHALPVNLSVKPADGPGWPPGANPVVHFYSDGSADAASISLSDGGSQQTIDISWLTGEVQLAD